MAPDFPDFVFVDDPNHWFHSTAGVLLFCLPAGLLVLWLYHTVAKRPLLDVAPDFFRVRISEADLSFRFAPASRLMLIVASLLIGSVSHVLWDSFTHPYGYFVRHWPFLSVPVMTYRLMPLCRALQLGCSVAAVVIIAGAALWWFCRRSVVKKPMTSRLTPGLRRLIPLLVFFVAAGIGYFYGFIHNHGEGWKYSLVDMTIAAMSMGCGEILLFSGAWHIWRRRQNSEPAEMQARSAKITATVER